MIPTIYEPQSTDFFGAGLGFISDCKSCIVNEERNGQNEVLLTFPITTKYSQYLEENGYQLRCKPNDEDIYNVYVIYRHFKDMSTGLLTVYARSRTYKLGHRMIKQVDIINQTGTSAMATLQQGLDLATDIDFYSDIQTVSSTSFEASDPLSCVAGQSGSLLQRWGGEIKHQPFRLSLLKQRGRENVTTIRYKKNLSGLTIDFDYEGMRTRILPYADIQNSEAVTERIYGEYVDSPLVDHYDGEIYAYPVQFTEEQGVTDSDSLDRVAKTYFTSINPGCDKPKISLKVNIIKLDESSKTKRFANFRRLSLCDTFTVYHERFDIKITAKVTGMKYDSLLSKVVELTAGDAKVTFFESQKNELQEVLKSQASKSYMSSFTDYLSQVISGNDGGNVIWWPKNRPTDLFFIDTDSLETAKNVLRINKSGIGFSDVGWNGPYKTAWTMDGNFNANFIRSGKIMADIFMTSFNGVGDALQLAAGALQIFNEKVKIMELTKKGLEFWRGNDPIGNIGTTGKNFNWIGDLDLQIDRALYIGLNGGDFTKISNDNEDGIWIPSKNILSKNPNTRLTIYCNQGVDILADNLNKAISIDENGVSIMGGLKVDGKPVTGGGTGGGGWNGDYPPEITTQAEKFAWQAWVTLLSMGYSKEAAAGILGNIQGEAGPSMNPDTEQIGGPAYGAIQFDGSAYPLTGAPTNNGREYFQRLHTASGVGGDYREMAPQMKVVNWAMTNGQWIGAVDPTTVGGFKGINSPEQAAYAFEKNFERPASAHPERQGWAREWYNKFKDLVQPSGRYGFPVLDGTPVTSWFGPRWGTMHNGIDFGGVVGDPIFAAQSGTVVYSYSDPDMGEWVVIKHDSDAYMTGYAHNSARLVNVGDKVSKGQQIARMGSTGDSTGPHLHFAVQTAQWSGYVDPAPFLGLTPP